MAEQFEIHMEWINREEFDMLLQTMPKRFEQILIEEMTKFGSKVEEGAKELAPEDSTDLVDSINFGKARRYSGGVIVEGGANTPYALRRHEEPYREGVHDKYDEGSKFPDYYVHGRGAGTRSKGSWRGYQAGRKYLENAVKATNEDWDDMLERVMERVVLEGLL